MDPVSDTALRVTLPRVALAVIAGLGLLLITIIVLLAFQLKALSGINERITETDRDLVTLSRDLNPTAERAPPFLSQAQRDLATIREVVPALDSSLGSLLREAVPALRQVRRADLPGSLASVPTIAARLGEVQGELERADLSDNLAEVPTIAARLGEVQGELERADLSGNLAPIPTIAATLADVEGELRRAELPLLGQSVAAIRERLELLPSIDRSTAGAERALGGIRGQIGALMKDVQEIRERVRSLDRKTGGEFPSGDRRPGPRRR